ncbi:DUF3265 domain-containing protein [Vibrio vulnificus]|nr:DUF3265 domain-containing protein [Vibrio vulnificus]ELX4200161.1 DUF3265 domain-containing protein [Vibrio vulnificus]
MTKRLRGIHAAWHFCYAVGFGVESGLRKLGLDGIHPLTQRYELIKLISIGVINVRCGKFGRYDGIIVKAVCSDKVKTW